jgi:hypothetical protein
VEIQDTMWYFTVSIRGVQKQKWEFHQQ